MYRQKDRFSLIVCLASVLELDRPVLAVCEERRRGERWQFRCCRGIEQWKVTPASHRGAVFGHLTGTRWSFYDTCSCTHIEVIGHEGRYRVWDYSGLHAIDITFLHHTATLIIPSTGYSQQFTIEA
jgi:hypothetical protein